MKDLEKSREYSDPPLPNIQAARLAYIQQNPKNFHTIETEVPIESKES